MIDQQRGNISSATLDVRSNPDSIEMEGMVRRFNKDKLSGKVSMTDWIEELTPKLA